MLADEKSIPKQCPKKESEGPHPFHQMSKLWADQGRAGIAGVHVQPSTLYQGDGGGDGRDVGDVGDDVLLLGDGDFDDDSGGDDGGVDDVGDGGDGGE